MTNQITKPVWSIELQQKVREIEMPVEWLTEIRLNGVDDMRKLVSLKSWADVSFTRLNPKSNVV